MPLGHAGEATSMEPGVSPGYSFVGSQVSQSIQHSLGTMKDPGDVARKAAAGAL